MQNVPYHKDVVAFGQAICAARGGEYEIACEHSHSCCILIARVDRFKVGGVWHTHIDYDRFQALCASGAPFTTTDYMRPTPEWAVFGHVDSTSGFDPKQTRVRKERRHPGKSNSSSCATSMAGDDVGNTDDL
jgi:tRNA wybutosine-synthesizing protein 1